VDQSVFDGIKAAVVADRPAYFKDFLDNRRRRPAHVAWTHPDIVNPALLDFLAK
jgi:hypothetical protein